MSASVTPSSLSHSELHQPLAVGARVRLDPAACLPERFPANQCGLCITACPLSLLESSGGAPAFLQSAKELGDACVGCGQCAVCCPSGALQVDGFTLPAEIPDEPELLVDCWRVPAAESPAGTVRVPCLGGLHAGWLLELFDASGERPIRLLDREQCGACPAGSGIKGLLDTITEIRLLLFECGVDINLMPMMAWRPCDAPLLPPIPEKIVEVAIPRRSFFRAMLGEGAKAAEAIRMHCPEPRTVSLRTAMQPVERLRKSLALSRIAQRHEREVPARALPQLSLGHCDGHGICAAVCPSGALQRTSGDDGASIELRFSSALCIGCAQCTRVCPDRALRFMPEGGRAGIEVLGRWHRSECQCCGAEFAGSAAAAKSASNLCPICRKTDQLSQGVAGLLQPSAVRSVCSDVSQS